MVLYTLSIHWNVLQSATKSSMNNDTVGRGVLSRKYVHVRKVQECGKEWIIYIVHVEWTRHHGCVERRQRPQGAEAEEVVREPLALTH